MNRKDKRAAYALEYYNALVENPGTGSGGPSDNSIHRIYRTGADEEFGEIDSRIDELYKKDAILQQAIYVPIVDSLSEWREVSTALKAEEDRLSYQANVMNAGVLARKRGKALIIPILVDGDGKKITLSKALEKIREQETDVTIARLMVVEKFEENKKTVTDVLSPFHGEPINYKLGSEGVTVHGSRVIPMFGTHTKTSLFQAIEEYYGTFHLGRQDVSRAVQEANFLVFKTKMQKLQDAAAAKTATGETVEAKDLLQDRLRNLRCNANNNNAYAIDKEFEDIVNIPKANIADMQKAVDQMAQFLAGAADIPISRLFAKSIGSLANSSQVEIQNYILALHGLRFMVLEPSIKALDKFVGMFAGIDDLDFTWNPLAIERFLETKPAESPADGD